MTDLSQLDERRLAEGLQALPQLDPPEHVWTGVRRHIRPRWWIPKPMVTSSLAASVVVAAMLPLLVLSPLAESPGQFVAEEPTTSDPVVSGGPVAAEVVKEDGLARRPVTLQQSLESVPRIVREEDPVQVVLAKRIASIDATLQTRNELDREAMKQLIKQRNDMLNAYMQVQRRRDSNALSRASY